MFLGNRLVEVTPNAGLGLSRPLPASMPSQRFKVTRAPARGLLCSASQLRKAKQQEPRLRSS